MTTEISESAPDVLKAFSIASGTDIGMRREENQDNLGVLDTDRFRIFIVADGMGGVQGGAIASKLAIEVFSNFVEDAERLSHELICTAIETANVAIFQRGNDNPALAGMGTTFVALACEGTSLYVINVGDSRAYRVRDGNIKQLTQDHTLVMDLIRSGAITPDQAENHPVSHMLTRSLGPTPSIQPDCWVLEDGPARGDKYLLCSDGLYNMVSDEEILGILTEMSIEDAKQECIRLANERGGTDNITVMVLEVGAEFPIGPEAFPISLEEKVDSGDETVGLLIEGEKLDSNYSGNEPISTNGRGALTEETDQGLSDTPSFEESIGITEMSGAYRVDGEASAEEEASSLEDASQTPPSSEDESRLGGRLFSGVIFSIIGVCAIIGLNYYQKSVDTADSRPHVEDLVVDTPRGVLAPLTSEAQLARIEVSLDVSRRASLPEAILPLPILNSDIPSSVESSSDSLLESTSLYNGLSLGELEDISRRKAVLRKKIGVLEERIESFDLPLSGTIAQALASVAKRRETANRRLDEVRNDIDIATRRLTVWYGRKKRLKSTDHVNLATEVAVSSNRVKESKEIFERATWEYLKQAEILRYNPSDNVQKKKVEELTRLRKQRLQELSRAVEIAIDEEVSASDGRITDLTLKRDLVESEITELDKERSYLKTLMSSNVKQRNDKKRELQEELKVSETEYKDLLELLPDDQEVRFN